MSLTLLAIGAAATFFTGAYVGTVVDNATQAPAVEIKSNETQIKNASLSNPDLIKAGLLGVGAWFIYRKYLKAGKWRF